MTGDSWPHFERAEQKGGCYPFQDHLLIELYWLFRYFRVSPPMERQQTIWVVVGITIGILLKYDFYLPGLFFPTLCTNILLQWLNIFVYEHLFLCIPLSIGFALLHSGLWKKNRAQETMPIE